MARIEKDQVVAGVSQLSNWWIKERLKKLRNMSHDTMSLNPFMAPLLFGIHRHADFEELAEFLLGGHFMQGHATGFGKLVDEKILPRVFETKKLDKKFRQTPPFGESEFSEIDHILPSDDGDVLMTLKAGRWTIQLTMAMQLNHSFVELLRMREEGVVQFSRLVVGVFYGTRSQLTDKFDIITGICSGAKHRVTDIRDHVEVVAGREFWSWINEGEPATQDWVLDGVIDGINKSKEELLTAAKLLEQYKSGFTTSFQKYITSDGINWHSILSDING